MDEGCQIVMEILIGLIVIFLLNALLAFFYFKWKEEKYHYAELKKQAELSDVVIQSSIGGYYYWQKFDGNEIFSDNLVSMLRIRRDIDHFNEFLGLFTADRQTVKEVLVRLKEGEQSQIRINVRILVSGRERHFQCSGYRIEDNKGEMVGVILWFFDVTDYVQRLNRVMDENHHIRRQVRNYMGILNSLPFPIWQRNIEDFSVSYHNAMYSRYVDDGKINAEQEDVPQLYEGMQYAAKEAFKKERSLQAKKHLICDGERHLLAITEQSFDNKKSILGYGQDITAMEETEQELVRHISAHANLLESSSSAMAVYGRDTKLKFYNQAFVRLGNFDQLWLGSSPSYSAILEYLREKRLLPEQADFRNFREQQLKLFENVIEMREDFFYLPDGRTLRVIVIPHALGGLLFSYEDVTDRLAMERSYNTLIAVQKATLDHVHEGVLLYGSDGILKLYNPQYANLWPSEISLLDKKPHISELLEASKSLYKFEDDQAWKIYKENIIADLALRSPVIRHIERTDGKLLDLISVPLLNGDTLMSFVDVTHTSLLERSLRERNEALEQADKLKTEFLANVSYELRTPLTTIMGFSELLMDPAAQKLTKGQKEYIQSIHDSSLQLMGLINDVLDLASIEAGYLTLDVKPMNICTALESVVSIFSDKASQNQIEISVECSKESLMILADERRIKQVLFNIINNALKFTPEKGKIRVGVRLEKDQHHIALFVADTGVGIPKAEQQKVFDRFYTASSARRSGKSGTGLGLAVVKHVIELHGGKVALESKEGKGTTLTCLLETVA